MPSRSEYINSSLPIQQELLMLFRPDAPLVIFDVGACEGEDSIRYARLFPNASVFAFEPSPKNVQLAEKNIRDSELKQVQLFPLALSDKNGKATFHLSSGAPDGAGSEDWDYGNKSGSLLSPGKVLDTHQWLKFDEQVTVETKTLLDFCTEKKIEAIDFLHMDVQGAELMVLLGAGPFVRRIKAIWLEVETVALYKNQPLQKDVEAFMKKHGFYLAKTSMEISSGDQLYINQNYFPQPSPAPEKNIVWKIGGRIRNKVRPVAHQFRKHSYSQTGEDLIVKFIFDAIGMEKPSYLDVGAFHPFLLSNTALFYECGSRGINVEPNPENFSLFTEHRRHDVNLNVGVSDQDGKLDYFSLSSPTMNTFSEKDAMELISSGKCTLKKKITIETKTITQILREHHQNTFPDFLTLDVEGYDEAIIQSIDFERHSPVVICLETISYSEDGKGVKNEAIIRFLSEKGYLVYADTYINTIFVQRNKWIRS